MLTITSSAAEEKFERHEEPLVRAGAQMILYETAGGYQGEWIAIVMYRGMQGWVGGYYGSCSGCDTLLGLCNWNSSPEEVAQRMKEYGEELLEGLSTDASELEEYLADTDFGEDEKKEIFEIWAQGF